MSHLGKYSNIVSFLLFQLGWWSCVFTAQGRLEYSVLSLILGLNLAFHFLFSIDRSLAAREFVFIVLLASMGFLIDLAFASNSVFVIKGEFLLGQPLWLLVMWLLFSLSIGTSFDFLKSKHIYAKVLGAVLGPATYWIGNEFGILEVELSIGLGLYAVYWGSLFSLAIGFRQRFVEREAL